ncbi:13562_t:CDS:2, partial [Gigaspora margarita]
TQATTVQVTEKNKEGACFCTNKKRKAEESEEREESRKMLKHKEEIPQNALVEVNNENISLQQMEQKNMDVQTQLAEAPVVDNKDTSKQSWAKIMNNDSDNLKDITNTTNPLRGSTSTNEEIENAHEPNLYSDHKREDMQIDIALHETQAEPNEVTINEKSIHDEKVGTPSAKEGNTHEETVKTPIIT